MGGEHHEMRCRCADCQLRKGEMGQCDDCGRKGQSKPMLPPPALGVFGLPERWELGVCQCSSDARPR